MARPSPSSASPQRMGRTPRVTLLTTLDRAKKWLRPRTGTSPISSRVPATPNTAAAAAPRNVRPTRTGVQGGSAPAPRQGNSGGGGGPVTVNVINNAQGTKTTQQQRTEGGMSIIDVVIEQVEASIAGNIAQGRGPMPDALSGTYGLSRIGS